MNPRPFSGAFAAATLASLMLAGCGGGGTSTSDPSLIANADSSWTWSLPVNFPTPAVPADNPMSEDKFQLGRRLFYDKRLSGNGTQACASCHFQHLAFTDGKPVSTGSTGEETARNAPSIANVAYNPTFTWANYSLVTLERHMLVPMFGENPTELGIDDSRRDTVLQRFRAGGGRYLLANRAATEFAGQRSALLGERASEVLDPDNILDSEGRKKIIELAAQHRLPAMYEWSDQVREGGLMSYGASLHELYQRVAAYVDRILRGARPGDLPVELPDRLELAINLRTAREIGLQLPQSLLSRASELIE